MLRKRHSKRLTPFGYHAILIVQLLTILAWHLLRWLFECIKTVENYVFFLAFQTLIFWQNLNETFQQGKSHFDVNVLTVIMISINFHCVVQRNNHADYVYSLVNGLIRPFNYLFPPISEAHCYTNLFSGLLPTLIQWIEKIDKICISICKELGIVML